MSSLSINSGYGLNALLTADATTVHTQLDQLTEQASTGLIGDTYAQLGGGAAVSLTLSPQITALQTAQTNINQATGAMDVTQNAMSQIGSIAATFVADIPDLNNMSSSEVNSVASSAQSALQEVANLLDTTYDGSYVFAGQDSANPPVPSPDDILSSGFYTQINSAVSALGTAGAPATTAATLAVASSNASGTSPFSAYLSQPGSLIAAPLVQTGEGGTVQTGLVASANMAVTSTGTSTTGSYMRDLMRALATLGSLSSSQINDSGFGSLVQDTGSSLSGVVTAMSTDVGTLGNTQAQLTTIQSNLSATATALTGQVSSAQDVDMASTLSQLTQVQTQLEESYRLIVQQGSLSLMNFVPA